MYNQNQLEALLKNAGIDNQETLEKIKIYIENLKKWNKTINLTSKNFDIINHVKDSLMFFELFYNPSGKLIDIGSGNGFPAIILAIIISQLNITMVESNAKKCAFLRDTCLKASINNVLILNKNILNLQDTETFDFATIRGLKCSDTLETKIYSLLKNDTGSLLIWAYPPPISKKFKLTKSIAKNNKYLHLYIKVQVAQQPI